MANLPSLDPRMATIAENWFHVEMLDEHLCTVPSGLIVGEQPSPRRQGRGQFAMWPWPPGSAGGRLMAMSELDVRTYLTRLARVNLVPELTARWSARGARIRAETIARQYGSYSTDRRRWPRLVLCGARVSAAFGLDTVPSFERVYERGVAYVVIPHPSGRNRAYNDESIGRKAGRAVRWAAKMRKVEN